jgi:hypothetical protein
MFRSATDHHQGVQVFLVKITELKMWVFICGDVVMRQHNIQCIYMVYGVVRRADCCHITTSPHMNTHILILWFYLGTHELPDDDQLLIETCRNYFNCFSEWHFKWMFYYIEVYLLAHYIQWIKMHGETLKMQVLLHLNFRSKFT